ncbi:Mariner Mos1 transposase [Eumeta japonica]|uniref:Mariner Mos1 transposase n=1 Tax=Eumeta variegata TaxID=151549 RepID=A0A4C1VNI6_EUMVA|nr:Mariner Mos1 transposase [Eumeta japonica]
MDERHRDVASVKFTEFDRRRSMLTDEFKVVRLELVVVLQNIDAVQELIMKDRHVTYRKIKASLGIKVLEEIRKSNRQPSIILHHDNASCHTSAEIARLLVSQKIELTGYLPYSPYLALKDFYLFPGVKNKLHGQRFSSREEVIDAYKMQILEVLQ